MAPSTGFTEEKPFVSNQEYCLLLEKFHPAWRDFSCSWMRREGHLGNSPDSGEWELEWGKTGSPANSLGTATHHLAVAGREVALL